MNAFRAIGAVLLLGLLVWILATTLFGIGRPSLPDVLGLEAAFEGNLKLPAEEIKATLDQARERMFDVNEVGGWFRLAGEIATWVSFAATAAITLIVGSYGRAPIAAGAPGDTNGLPARSLRLIGFLAALAAVLTAFGSLSLARSHDYLARAEVLRAALVDARADIAAASDAEAARGVLDRIALLAAQ